MRHLVLLSILAGPAALAQEGYEDRLVQWGLSLHSRELEPAPEGKRIEEVLLAIEDIFAPSDPYPLWFNAVHARTREMVIRRELLFQEGAPYRAELADETERNLRRLFILAVARVVPVKGRADGVAVLVVTKDRWSLRLNSEFNYVGNLLQYLRLQPTEQNFLGLNQQVSLEAVLRLDTLTLGQLFQDRRLFGQELAFGETASLVFNRDTLELEGSRGRAVFGRPLYSLDSHWGFSTEADWLVYRRRRFRGPQIWPLEHPDGGRVPFEYDVGEVSWAALYTRRWGRTFKLDLSGGLGGHSRRYQAPADTGLSEAERAFLEAGFLPRSEDAAYLTVLASAFSADYRVLRDVDTFALSEDYRIGPAIFLEARWAEPVGYARSRFAEVGLTARHRLLLLDGIASLTVAGAARHQPEQGGWVNRRLAAELVAVSPPLEGGRVVLRGLLDLRRFDLDRHLTLLGGGNGLRGAAAESQAGPNLLLLNLEYRTRPVEVRTLFLGFVLFYDMGSAFERSPVLTHTIGLGTRLLIPQFNQETIRVDLGLVIGGEPGKGDLLSASFGQVTDYRPDFLDRPLD
ncbi:MAG: hypothetical protein HYZ28_05830 [Myxococcales bacterium]|nr:hypothetical protein [Myxococcales bacterium]